jgi:cyclopropane fatty-acyl-phospholipid synthase-like methyltransferase
MSDIDDIDPIALAGTRAKGKRPYFFKDPDVDRVLSIAMVVAMEHAVTRQRLDALERLIESKGLLSRTEIEQFQPDATVETERGQWMQGYIARVLRIVQQESEALESGAAEPPLGELIEQMREP